MVTKRILTEVSNRGKKPNRLSCFEVGGCRKVASQAIPGPVEVRGQGGTAMAGRPSLPHRQGLGYSVRAPTGDERAIRPYNGQITAERDRRFYYRWVRLFETADRLARNTSRSEISIAVAGRQVWFSRRPGLCLVSLEENGGIRAPVEGIHNQSRSRLKPASRGRHLPSPSEVEPGRT
jgi:hypothetical protein